MIRSIIGRGSLRWQEPPAPETPPPPERPQAWQSWLLSPPGRYVIGWEVDRLDEAVGDVFGFHAVQLGLPMHDCLRANRMPHRIRVALAGDPVDTATAEAGLAGSARSGVVADIRAAAGTADAGANPFTDGAAGTGRGDRAGDGVAAGGVAASAATAGPGAAPAAQSSVLVEQFEELPFDSQSIDLVVLPHVLEFAADPHQVLREVDRVLRPEGRVIITGFNPVSLWGARQLALRSVAGAFLPRQGQFMSVPRLRDWFKLLSFEMDGGRYGCYRPPCRTQLWLDRTRFMEKAGDRWWPICGAVYMVSAVKRVRGMRIIGPAWKRKRVRSAVAVAASQRRGIPSVVSRPQLRLVVGGVTRSRARSAEGRERPVDDRGER
jgi:SAM-dependent methyltransferase